MKFLKNWTLNLEKIPAYASFKTEFVIDVDYELLKMMYESDNDVFTEDRKKLLLPVLEAIDKKTNTLKIKHNNRFDMGRFYANNSISPICLSRHIKHTLFHYMDWCDLDMVKGHPSILYNIANNNNISLPYFERYLKNPNHILDEMIEFYSGEEELTRSDVKGIFNIKIYGGSHNTWVEQMGKQGKDIGTTAIHEFEAGFEQECKMLIHLVYVNNPQLTERVKGNETNEYKIKNKVMSYFCGTIENEILYICYKFLEKKGILKSKNKLLEYDGICFKNPNVATIDEDIDELNYKIKNDTKLNVKMMLKSYDPEYVHLDLIEKRNMLDLVESTMDDGKVADNDNCDDSCVSICEDNSFESVSNWFEIYHAKIINRGIFVKQLDNDNIIMSKPHIKMAYEHMVYDKVVNGKIIQANFINDWLNNNPNIRRYDDIDVFPNNEKCPPNVFNMWRKFDMELITKYTENKEALAFVLNHIKILCDNDEVVYQYFIKWIGQMIQFPEIKSNCPTFISKEGAGKGTLMKLLEKMLGSAKVFETTNPSRDVWGDFNGRMANTFLINLNELSKKETLESEGKIKALITDSKMTINNKGSNQYDIQSYHRFIISTNNEEPVNSKKDDRRKFIIRCSDELIGNRDYFNTFYKYLDDVNIIKTCYEYFKAIPDMDKFNKLELPKTEYQQQMQECSVSPIENWLKQLAYDNQDNHAVLELAGTEILELFEEWKISNKIDYTCDALKLMVRLKRLNIGGVEKHKTKTCNKTAFDFQKMKQHFGFGCLL